MKPRQTTFGELKQGDRFALSRDAFDGTDEFMNMKVAPAILCDPEIAHVPFNVVRLSDGSVRTFRDEEKVWTNRKAQ